MIPDHAAIVQGVSDAHPHLLRENRKPEMTELLWRSALALAAHDPKWGLLSKSEAENHTVIAGRRVAVDALAYGDSDQIVDIFANAYDGPGTGALAWHVDGRRPSNTRIDVPPFEGEEPSPGPDPDPDPPPPVEDPTVVALLTQIAAGLQQALLLLDRQHDTQIAVGNLAVVRLDEIHHRLGQIVNRPNADTQPVVEAIRAESKVLQAKMAERLPRRSNFG
jgi:hypothetical protein